MKQWFILTFLSLSIASWGQSPYQLSYKTDGIIGGLALSGFALGWGLEHHTQALSLDEINQLNVSEINALDRTATQHYSHSAATRSDVGLYGSIGLGFASSVTYIVIDKKESNTFKLTLPLMWLETNVMTYGWTNVVKNTVQRTRPYVYQSEASLEEKLETDSRRSFFSGHTSMTAANAFFMAKTFSDYYPNSRFKPYVWALAAALPAWVGTERYLAGKHFPTDILAGYVFGAAVGYFVPHFHKTKHTHTNSAFQLRPFYSPTASGFSLVWNG